MTLLEIHIPENWPPMPPEEAGTGTVFTWLLREDGKLMRGGQSALEAIPDAAQCHLVVPTSRVLLSSVQPPAQNRKKFMQALPYAVEDRIMADPESIHVAAGEEQEKGEMPVAIVDRAWLHQVLDNLKGNGIKPLRVEIETLLVPCKAGVWSLIWRGDGGFVRQGPRSGFPLDGGDAEHPPAALRLATESTDNRPASIQLYLDGVDAPNLGAWSSALGIPVTSGGEWKWPASAVHGIDLLQGEFAIRSKQADWLPQLRPALVLMSLILGLQIAFTIGDWAMMKFEEHRLTASMEQSFRQAFPEAKAIVDAPLQMRRNLAEMRHNAGMLDENDFLPMLGRIAPKLGNEVRLHGLEYQQDNLKIRLTLPNPAAVETLRARLPQARLTLGNSTPAGLEAELMIGK